MEDGKADGEAELTPREIWNRYAGMVYSLGIRRTQSMESAEDVRQRVFLAVFQGSGGFRGECRLKTWIYQITLNECHQLARKERSEREKVRGFLESRESNPGQDNPGEQENRRLAGKILRLADPATLKALELIHSHGLSHGEVAALFGLSRVTITKRIRNFKAKTLAHLGHAAWN